MAEAIDCPICLEKFSSPVATVCGHVFCFECLRSVLEQKKVCPLCRSDVTMILPLHLDGGGEPAGAGRDEFVRSFNLQNSNHGVREEVFLLNRVSPWWPIFLMFPLLYLIWGFDLIPDSIPVLGFVDDVFVIIFVFICFHFVANIMRRRAE